MNGPLHSRIPERGHPHLRLAGDSARDPRVESGQAHAAGAVRVDDRAARVSGLGREEKEEVNHIRRWPWTWGYIAVVVTVVLILTILQSMGVIR